MGTKIEKYLVLSGFFGPVIFALVIFLSGLMYPGYDHANQVISDLGAVGSPAKDVMNFFGFMLFGLLIIAFSAGVYKLRGKSATGKVAAALFILGGLGVFLIGVFPSDTPCLEVPRFCPQQTSTAELHELATYSAFVFLFPAFISLVADVNLLRREESMKHYFIVAGILGLAIAYFAYTWLNAAEATLIGVKQRVTLAAVSILLMYTSLKLYRLKQKNRGKINGGLP